MSTPTEVIDLTSPPISVVDLPSDVESEVQVIEPPTATTTSAPKTVPTGPNGRNAQQGGGEARAKKKRTKKRKSTNSTPAQSACASRANSEERAYEPATNTSNNVNNNGSGRAKRKRNSTVAEDGGGEHLARRARKADGGDVAAADPTADAELVDTKDLFFVDLAPAPLPATRLSLQTVVVDVPNGVANVEGDGDAPKLLVPAHVTVLGSTPVEIIQSLSDGEVDEDFIDYLDFDDTKVRLSCIWCVFSVRACSNTRCSILLGITMKRRTRLLLSVELFARIAGLKGIIRLLRVL